MDCLDVRYHIYEFLLFEDLSKLYSSCKWIQEELLALKKTKIFYKNDSDGILATERAINGKKHGVERRWNHDHILREQKIYKMGKLHGEYNVFINNTTLTYIYKDDELKSFSSQSNN